MRLKGIDDVENHTQEDDSHAEADGNDKIRYSVFR